MRRKVTEKREERRDARNRFVNSMPHLEGRKKTDRQAVSDPKGFAERKSKKGVIKKDSKKRRVKAFA